MNGKILGTFKVVEIIRYVDLATHWHWHQLGARANVLRHDTSVDVDRDEHLSFIESMSHIGIVQPVRVGSVIRVRVEGVAS